MSWETLKKDSGASWYPRSTYNIPKDRSCWFTSGMQVKIHEVLRSLGPSPHVVELGVFLGAGSTLGIATSRDDLRLVCVDNFQIQGPSCPMRFRPDPSSPFFQGQGTAWEHFVNNTWEHRERIIPLAINTDPAGLKFIHSHLPDVAAVYVDSDHRRTAVRRQLQAIRQLWPSAVLLLDDFNETWPGIGEAVADMVNAGKISVADFDPYLADGRLLVIDPRKKK